MATILIIDNDPVFQTDLRAMLPTLGHTSVHVVDGASGLDSLRSHAPDVVFISLELPDGDGMRTLLEIRCLDPGIPIIALSRPSAMEHDRTLRMSLALGADATLTKPVSPSALLDVLETHLPSR